MTRPEAYNTLESAAAERRREDRPGAAVARVGKTTLDAYGHLWPDRDESTRATVEAVLRDDDRPSFLIPVHRMAALVRTYE